MTLYVPITPGGTILVHLEANTRDQAWENLLEDAKHMPYPDKEAFSARGYEVGEFTSVGSRTDEDDFTLPKSVEPETADD